MTLDVQAAMASLRSGEESVRRAVVEHLGQSGQPEAVGPLLVAVADDSWPVRQAAVEQLAAFRLEVLLPALEGALRDGENASVRNAAMEIYVRLGPAAAAPLLALLRDADEEVRQFSAVMLGSLKDQAAVVALIGALEDPDLNVRHAAAQSLGQIGSPLAVPPLIEALRDLPPGTGERKAVHRKVGPITLAQMLNEWALHDLGHIRQIAELVRARKYLAGAGPLATFYELKP
jgi:HEAT repeat protein